MRRSVARIAGRTLTARCRPGVLSFAAANTRPLTPAAAAAANRTHSHWLARGASTAASTAATAAAADQKVATPTLVGSVTAGPAPATSSSAPAPAPVAAAPAPASSRTRKPRIVVLGCGWGGFSFLSHLDRSKFDVYCVSPRNYFLFTPLLPSTTVGTLEFRAIIEPVRTLPDLTYYQSYAENIDTVNRTIRCREVFKEKSTFDLPYDHLVIACGAKSNTFGIPGVQEHAFFLKDLANARAIRNRILECFERATCHRITTYAEKAALSRFVVVGGGPTSVEFAAELHDFVQQDVRKWFPDLHLEIIVIEASDHVLGTFDENLSKTAMKTFAKRKIQILTNTRVKEVRAGEVVLGDGSVIQTGLVVWSTGLAPQTLNELLPWVKEPRSGRLIVDDSLQPHLPLPGGATNANGEPAVGDVVQGVYAIGDCAVPLNRRLPATAQVANQEAIYLAKHVFNPMVSAKTVKSAKSDAAANAPNAAATDAAPKPFVYNHQGNLAYIGGYKALADLGSVKGSGLFAWLFWRSAYFTKLMSWKNKILVPMFWFKSFFFGRDISRF